MLLRLRLILWQRWMMEGFCGESPGREAVGRRPSGLEARVESSTKETLGSPDARELDHLPVELADQQYGR